MCVAPLSWCFKILLNLNLTEYSFDRTKLDEISVLAYRMKTGLAKLGDAEKSVNELSIELVQKEKDLVVASKETDEVIELYLQSPGALTN